MVRRNEPLTDDDPRHGTPTGYCYWRCRCEACTGAQRQHVARWRDTRPPLAADDPRHGRLSTYTNYACRCDLCRAAGTKAHAIYDAAHPGASAARARRWYVAHRLAGPDA